MNYYAIWFCDAREFKSKEKATSFALLNSSVEGMRVVDENEFKRITGIS